MRGILATLLLLISTQTFAQFDYELYLSLTTPSSMSQNRKFSSVTEFQSEKKGNRTKVAEQHFFKEGFPSSIISFDQQGQVNEKKDFLYESTNRIKSINTFKGTKLYSSTEFETNQLGQVLCFTEYVYSSYDNEKLFLWKTFLDYNSNGTLKKTIKLEGDKKDTTEIVYYDNFGIKTKEIWNKSGLRTKKIEYVYNNDSTEMLQKEYEDDKTIYNTITHKYKNKKEIEKLDPATSNKPFYWKYDSYGRMIETNESFYSVVYNEYNKDGSLNNRTMKILFTDSGVDNFPNEMVFTYEYENWNK